jgi:hypothetical protein
MLFQAVVNFCPDLSRSKFHSKGERSIGNSKKQSNWNKSGIKNIPKRQPKSSRKRTKSNTKAAKNMDMNDGSKERLKLEWIIYLYR